MRIRNNILTIIILLLCSCNEKAEKQKPVQNSEPIIESKSELKIEPELENDYSISAELFAKDVLKENLRKHTFDISDLDKPVHAQIFHNVGCRLPFIRTPLNSINNYYLYQV